LINFDFPVSLTLPRKAILLGYWQRMKVPWWLWWRGRSSSSSPAEPDHQKDHTPSHADREKTRNFTSEGSIRLFSCLLPD